MDQKSPILIDIRDQASFQNGHITGSLHLDNQGVADFTSSADKSKPLIVCCYHGNMSQSAGAFLAERGFEEVYSLDGGYAEWAAKFPDDCEPD